MALAIVSFAASIAIAAIATIGILYLWDLRAWKKWIKERDAAEKAFDDNEFKNPLWAPPENMDEDGYGALRDMGPPQEGKSSYEMQ